MDVSTVLEDGMSKLDIFLVVSWVLFLALLGPCLISARNTYLVVGWIVIIVTLLIVTGKRLEKLLNMGNENEDN